MSLMPTEPRSIGGVIDDAERLTGTLMRLAIALQGAANVELQPPTLVAGSIGAVQPQRADF